VCRPGDDDEADRLDKELRDSAVERVRRKCHNTIADAVRVSGATEHDANVAP
jgi:hypothetical protein